MNLHKAGSSAGFNIALKREGEKKRSYYNSGYLYLITRPSIHPAKQSLTLFSGRDMVLSLWYDDSKLNALLYGTQGKVTKRERKKNR